MAAPFGDIISSLSLAAGESVRRNAGDTTFEAFTPQPAFTAQSANQIYAGPTSGGAAVPAFRGLVNADIPVPLTLTAPGNGDVPLTVLGAAAPSTYLFRVGKNANPAYFRIDSDGNISDIGGVNKRIQGISTGVYFPDGINFSEAPSAGNSTAKLVTSNSSYPFYFLQRTDGNGRALTVVADNAPLVNIFEVTDSSFAAKFAVNTTFDVGIGHGSPSAALHAIKTTEQMRLGYDGSNYVKTTVASNGAVTYDAVGSGAKHIFADDVDLSERLLQDGLDIEPYFVYEALMSQSGSSAPTAAVVKNTIGAIVWARVSAGSYTGTLTGAFSTQDKCWFSPAFANDIDGDWRIKLSYISADAIRLETEVISTGSGLDGLISHFPISIRIKKP